MSAKTVSIITVCFNAASTIAHTLASVAQQKGVDIEHIIIDGCSNDGTQGLVSAFVAESQKLNAEQSGKRDFVFLSESDSGLYDAMNKAVTLAKGDLLAFLNADDVYAHDTVVAEALDSINRYQVRCVYSDLVFVDEEHAQQVKRVWRSRPFKPGLCFSGWMPAHPTLFMHRTDFLELGGFDLKLKYHADLEFCARALEINQLSSRYIPAVWVKMRLGGISTGAWSTRIKGNWESYVALRKLGLKRNPLSFFIIKFGRKLPEFFDGVRHSNAALDQVERDEANS